MRKKPLDQIIVELLLFLLLFGVSLTVAVITTPPSECETCEQCEK